ncbi:MAG: indolepyruvate oxidoreductase subunit beta [Candidatus Kariarchaeaceae archaeon]|jgi:indolepyruvate ferredoxin oxidoreductase beta subunit
MNSVDIIVTGIGGQGTVSLGHLLAETLNDMGIPFVAAETHGMSQRGGSVIFHLRIGSSKYSPLIEEQTADCIIAGEPMEALRALHYLAPDGLLITDTRSILSPVARQLGQTYPEIELIFERLESYTNHLYKIPATDAATALGELKTANIILLGALLELGILPLSYDLVADKIGTKWPKYIDLNHKALDRGRKLVMANIDQQSEISSVH